MRRIFVIMPFGIKYDYSSPKEKLIDFDVIYNKIIKPAGVSAGWNVTRIDEVVSSGTITNQYLKEIMQAEVVIADISIPNPNVFYELGIRQSISTGSTILIALEGSQLPFDVSDQRVIFYSLDLSRLDKSKERIVQALSQQALETSENPVKLFLEQIGASVNPKIDSAAFEQELQGRIERAENSNQLIAVWKWVQNYSPLPSFILLKLAKKLSDFSEWSISADVLRLAIEYRPDDFELLRELGWHISKQGREFENQALEAFERALSINPNDPETLGMMGGVLKRLGNYVDAGICYTEGAKISPNNLYMRVNQAAMQLLIEPSKPDLGMKLYKDLVEYIFRNPEAEFDEWSQVILGEAFFVIGDIEKAKRHFILASRLAKSPKSLRSVMDQLNIFRSTGFKSDSFDEIIELLSNVLKRFTDSSQISVVLPETEMNPDPNNLPVIIHLSDLHFGKIVGESGVEKDMHRFHEGEYSIPLSKHLINEFCAKKAHFSYNPERLILVVSGDLTYTGKYEEFELAKAFLEEICEGLHINKEKVFIVPGNHDISWDLNRVNLVQRFDNYISFLVAFYGEEIFRLRYPHISWDLKIHSKRPEPCDIVNIFSDSKLNITIAGLNSCVYETVQNHYGFIGGRQIRILEDMLEKNSLLNEGIRIAVFHHHLHPFPEFIEQPKGTESWIDLSVVRDAGIVERQLQKLGFDIILHGHKHKPQIRETSIRGSGSLNKYSSKIIVCGVGSAGVSPIELEHNISNHYQVIEVLRNPRKLGTNFLKVEWRILDSSPEAEWVTQNSWDIPG